MASARQANPEIESPPVRVGKRRIPVIPAVLVAGLCAFIAFLFFIFRDHGRTRIMVHDQAAPAALAGRKMTPAQRASAPAEEPAARTVVEDRNSFRLEKGSKPVTLGPLRLRLTRADPSKSIYDVSVLSGRRSYAHKNLRVNQPLWIALKRGSGYFELVVTSLEKNQASGYWAQTETAPRMREKAARK